MLDPRGKWTKKLKHANLWDKVNFHNFSRNRWVIHDGSPASSIKGWPWASQPPFCLPLDMIFGDYFCCQVDFAQLPFFNFTGFCIGRKILKEKQLRHENWSFFGHSWNHFFHRKHAKNKVLSLNLFSLHSFFKQPSSFENCNARN